MGGPLQTGQVSSKSVRWLVPPLPGRIVDALLTVPFTLLRCCWRSGEVVKWISMFENSAKIYFKTFAWFDPSIKSYLFMVSCRILLRSLRVYILKQLLLSISVNSGFRNIYRAARVGVYEHYLLDMACSQTFSSRGLYCNGQKFQWCIFGSRHLQKPSCPNKNLLKEQRIQKDHLQGKLLGRCDMTENVLGLNASLNSQNIMNWRFITQFARHYVMASEIN